jgi:CBS domain containing-hemolysin-like protein
MVPRVDMVYLDATEPLEKNLEVMRSHTYTRYPLCEGDPDHPIGMVHIKDLVRIAGTRGDIRTIRREMLYVPETKSIDRLLREFQWRKLHMAIVVDEFGGTAGLLTLEDILEQIVGEIHDEFEEPVPEVQELEPGQWLIDGRAPLLDLRADYSIELPEGEPDTVGGWVLDRAGAIPSQGEQFDVDGYAITVREMDGPRVRKVLIQRTAAVEHAEHDLE